MSAKATPKPGSDGEHLLQDLYRTEDRADRFYRDQMLDTLTPRMVGFLREQTQMIVATVDTDGRPDVSVRFGERGFVTALDEKTLCWPELRGNGVLTTLGNIAKTPAAHLMFLDNSERIGLHLRGDATIVEAEDMPEEYRTRAHSPSTGRAPDRWVVLTLETSYIHCRKHFPKKSGTVQWGTDDVRAKGGDYFGAKGTPSPWSEPDKG